MADIGYDGLKTIAVKNGGRSGIPDPSSMQFSGGFGHVMIMAPRLAGTIQLD
jgi:hypothetical protein